MKLAVVPVDQNGNFVYGNVEIKMLISGAYVSPVNGKFTKEQVEVMTGEFRASESYGKSSYQCMVDALNDAGIEVE